MHAVETEPGGGYSVQGRPVHSVTVMSPMRNEAAHIEGLVADLAAQDFEGEVEVLVADGNSTDDSVEILLRAAERHGLEVRVLQNPDGHIPHGLNRCIAVASGDLLVRMDCHSRYPPDYLSRIARASEETGADVVGGVVTAEGRTPWERAVACAMTSPFGGILPTPHGDGPRVEVTTLPYGAFRPAAFERIGVFDESFVKDEDDELTLRIRLAGGRIVRDPSIRVRYTPRGSLRRVFGQYFDYGLWKPLVIRKHGRSTSARSLAPAAFVMALIALLALAPWVAWARWLLAALVLVYGVAAVAFGAASVRRARAPWRLLPRVVATFPTFHVAHGLGTVVGATRLAVGRPPKA